MHYKLILLDADGTLSKEELLYKHEKKEKKF